jgi:high affinity sulfate transporter 1
MPSSLISRRAAQVLPVDHDTSFSRWLWPDTVAGITTAAVVIPKAMAYAGLAGLPPEIGIYTVLVPMAVYVLLGASRVLSVSTTTTLGILTAASLQNMMPGAGLPVLLQGTLSLTLLVGAFLLIAGLARLGLLADFISDPVLAGFKTGIGLVIIIDQIPKLIGEPVGHGWFGLKLWLLLRDLPQANPATTVLGLGLLALLLLLRWRTPRLPAPLIALALSLLAASFFDFGRHGIERIGALPAGLPHLRLPQLDPDFWTQLRAMLPNAAGIALMSFAETTAAARAFALPGEPPVQANREMVATGVGNLLGALFGGMPAGGGTTQTAVNRLAGARSQIAAGVTVAASVLVLLYLAPVIGDLPEAALAAMVIAYSIGLLKPRELGDILHVRSLEFVWALIAVVGVIVLGTMQGISVAVAASLLSLAYQTYNAPIYELARKPGTDIFRQWAPEIHPDETFPGLLMLRAEGRLYFGNSRIVADHFTRLVDRRRPRIVVFDLSAVFDIEYTALRALTELDDRLRNRGIILWLAGLNPEVLYVLARTPLGQRMDEDGRLAAGHIGKGRLFHNLEEAVDTFRALTPVASHEENAPNA